MLDVEPSEVVDAVEGLLTFNDHASAMVSAEEMDRDTTGEKADAMARALLADIEASARMLRDGMDSSDLKLLLAVLRDRVMLRLKGGRVTS